MFPNNLKNKKTMTTFEKTILSNIPEGILLTENDIIQFYNPQLLELLDVSTAFFEGQHVSVLESYGVTLPSAEELKSVRNYHTEVEISRIQYSPSQTGYIFRNMEKVLLFSKNFALFFRLPPPRLRNLQILLFIKSQEKVPR
jgi:nitrogen-specific signal transduction histidine kinase